MSFSPELLHQTSHQCPSFTSGSLYNLPSVDFPEWSCNTSLRLQTQLLKNLLWLLLQSRSNVFTIFCKNHKLSLCPLLPTFSLTVHPPSFLFFSCFTGLFAVLWHAGQDLASGHLHALFLLPGISFPTISTSFSIQAFTKGHPLSLHSSPYFILFQSTYQGFTCVILIDWLILPPPVEGKLHRGRFPMDPFITMSSAPRKMPGSW